MMGKRSSDRTPLTASSASLVPIIFCITRIAGAISEFDPSCSLHIWQLLDDNTYGISGYFLDGGFLCSYEHPS